MTEIHYTAIVDHNVEIGQGTKVWHWSHISELVEIGTNCTIGQNVFIGKGVKIGNNVKIQNNVSVFSGVELGDGVFCGPSVVFTNVNAPRAEIEKKHQFLQTKVGKGASIGANSTIVCGNNLGSYCFVGAGSVVTKDVSEFSLVFGNPAAPRGWVCVCGEILKDLGGQFFACSSCDKTYSVSGQNCRLSSKLE